MEFKILGPLEVREGDRRLACTGPKQRLLLGILLLRANEVVSTDRLIETLWGERPPATAAKALQMHVSGLRRLLEPKRPRGGSGRVLVTRPPGYGLQLEREQLDLHRFERLVGEAGAASEEGRAREAATMLRAALALWRGPPLDDLSYESWLRTDIARLEELRLAALEDRIEADLVLGRHADLVAELETLAARHPLRERPRAQLMLALYRSGRQADALGVYRDTRRALVEELGIEPGRELKELERHILAHDPALDAPGPERRPAAPRHRPTAATLVGRERELGELLSLLERSFSRSGGLALIGGEPGVGKSRLAEALAGEARERGGRVLVGRCWEAGGAPPYWPWVQALRSHLRETDPVAMVGDARAELAIILPELRALLPAPAPAASTAEGERFLLFEAVLALLRRAASHAPLVVILDDLHAADAPSLLFLRYLAGQLSGTPLLVVGCYRDTEVGADLRTTLTELSRDASVARLPLKGLAELDVVSLLELTMGRPPAAELAARVHAETSGNPLFAAEIGRLLASETPGARPLPPEGGLPIPGGVRDAIGRRLERRSARCREVLTLAAVLGREFDLEALRRASGGEQEELFEALDEAADAGVVGPVPEATGRLRFSHVLVRDALYEELSPTRRLRLHREIGDALEALYARDVEPHLAELAHHYLAAGGAAAAKAIDYSARAGARAMSQLGYEEAARHYASALDLLGRTGAGDQLASCELLLSLGEALSRAGDEAGAKLACRSAARYAETAGRADLLARAALGYGGRFLWGRASSDPGLVPLLERALAAVGGEDSPVRVRLLARLATALRDEPSHDRRVGLAREALDSARRIGDPATLAYALGGYWGAVEGPGDVERRIDAADDLISLGEQIGDKESAFLGHDYRLIGFWSLADRAGVDVELDALDGLADELRQPAQRWHQATCRTMVALMEGRFAAAEDLIAKALGLGQRAQSWNAAVSHTMALFVLRREQGRLAELEDTMARSVHRYPALLRFRCALAHLYGELGRGREARATLDDLLRRDLAHEHLDAEWLFSMSLLPDPCVVIGDLTAAARLYALLRPHERRYAEAPVEAIAGSVARGLGVLATMLRRFGDAERHFEVAIDTERRMRARPWLAHARHDLAAMLAARGARGDHDAARALVAEAVETYRELGMNPWAARASAVVDGLR